MDIPVKRDDSLADILIVKKILNRAPDTVLLQLKNQYFPLHMYYVYYLSFFFFGLKHLPALLGSQWDAESAIGFP